MSTAARADDSLDPEAFRSGVRAWLDANRCRVIRARAADDRIRIGGAQPRNLIGGKLEDRRSADAVVRLLEEIMRGLAREHNFVAERLVPCGQPHKRQVRQLAVDLHELNPHRYRSSAHALHFGNLLAPVVHDCPQTLADA